MTTLKAVFAFFGFYYLLTTLAWLPWATVVNWSSFVSTGGAYLVGGLLSFILTVTWGIEQDEKKGRA